MRWNCTSMENMEGDICIIHLESTVRQNNPVGKTLFCWVSSSAAYLHLGRKASQNIDSLQGTESIEPRRSKRPTRTTPATVASMRSGAWVFAMPIFFFLADLTQSGWGWRRCGGCGPWCLESSCSAACTPSCSLWSQPGAARRKQEGRREETIKRTATKSGESGRC